MTTLPSLTWLTSLSWLEHSEQNAIPVECGEMMRIFFCSVRAVSMVLNMKSLPSTPGSSEKTTREPRGIPEPSISSRPVIPVRIMRSTPAGPGEYGKAPIPEIPRSLP
ncbi:MAG: hypothetical protein A4E42_01557 [Methanoregulaceae archaeon PtaU1.Bin222]|nr:MAG: hypothetical protein A4E42_01557 [Methanoregulaceae archaeon PtaU1.Bin222]